MASDLSVYNLAEGGVNTTLDAIHLDDGELTKAQNTQPDIVGEFGSIRKRDGLAKLNSGAMAGTITGFVALPLPDNSSLTRTFYLAWDDAGGSTSNTFRKSTNGTTWTTVTVASKPQEAVADLGSAIAPLSMPVRWAQLANKLYYPGNDYISTGATATPATIHVYDGTTDYLLAYIPIHTSFNYGSDRQGVLNILPLSRTTLLVSTYDGNGATGRGRVMLMDITAGTLTQLGPQTSITGAPLMNVQWQGKIYIGTFASNLTNTTVYWVRSGDTTLTQDVNYPTVAGEFPIDGMVFLGDLYVGTSAGWPAANAIASHIYKLAASTRAWTTVATNSGTATGNFIGPFILSQNGLTMYNFFSDGASIGPVLKIQKTTNGSSWSDDYDVAANVGATYINSGHPILDTNGDIYWPVFDSNQKMRVLKNASGAWSIVDSTSNITIRGPLHWIRQ